MASWQFLIPELTFEILTHAFGDSKLRLSRPAYFPWHLGHVCRSWRDLFVTSPQFWRAFYIDFWNNRYMENPYLGPCKPDIVFEEQALELVMLCIHRTKDHPISFEYDSITYGTSGFLELRCQIFEVLVAESSRWYKAHLVLQPEEVAILHRVKPSFPLLHALRFRMQHSDNHDHLNPDVFVEAPHLTDVAVNLDLGLKFRWSIVKAMEVEVSRNSSFLALLDTLRETKCLEILILNCARNNVRVEFRYAIPIELPSLKILSVGCTDHLLFFSCPALEQLWINNGLHWISRADQLLFRNRVSTFFSSTRHLRLFVYRHPEDASTVLQHMPRTDHLELFARDPNTFKSLISLCPNASSLRKLTMRLGIFHVNDSLIALADAIKGSGKGDTRERRFECIETIVLEVYCSFNMDSTALQEECDARGIQLVIKRIQFIEPGRSESPHLKTFSTFSGL